MLPEGHLAYMYCFNLAFFDIKHNYFTNSLALENLTVTPDYGDLRIIFVYINPVAKWKICLLAGMCTCRTDHNKGIWATLPNILKGVMTSYKGSNGSYLNFEAFTLKFDSLNIKHSNKWSSFSQQDFEHIGQWQHGQRIQFSLSIGV